MANGERSPDEFACSAAATDHVQTDAIRLCIDEHSQGCRRHHRRLDFAALSPVEIAAGVQYDVHIGEIRPRGAG